MACNVCIACVHLLRIVNERKEKLKSENKCMKKYISTYFLTVVLFLDRKML